jgi:glucose dehydrogenase
MQISKALVLVALAAFCVVAHAQNVPWPAYGGENGDHYSRLTQINRANVQRLQKAWTFDTGEKGNIETNPIIIGRTLYAYTPTQKVIALDAVTGKLKWKFDSGLASNQPARGVAYWTDGPTGKPKNRSDERIFAGVMNFLYCLDAKTGKPIASFGENGRIDLRKGLREPWQEQSIALTTPGSIYKDLIIVGGRNPEAHPAPPGDVRAFDAHTGALRWIFHTIPRPGEPGVETWPPDAWKTAGAANNWAGMTVDTERGIVYAPTGSAVMDFYGADRIGDDLYANTILALDAETGKLLWHFQGVHHDIWDRDFPAAPALYTVQKNGQPVPALAQITKQAYVYLFNRVTGEPLFPIHEHPFPASTVPGEKASPTQPAPDAPAPFGRQELTADMLTNRTPEAHEWAVKEFSKFRSNGQFLPFAVDQQTIIFPGYDGGGEWNGPAIDPASDTLFVGSTEMAWTGGLERVTAGGSPGERIYMQQCAICHGINRAGSPPSFPSLVDVESRLTTEKILSNIRTGTGRMPSFPNLDDTKLTALLDYMRTPVGAGAGKEMQAAPAATAEPLNKEVDKAGAQVYADRCAICHGDHEEGIPPDFPMLTGIGSRTTEAQLRALIHDGRTRMPPMTDIPDADIASLMRFLGIGAAPAGADEQAPLDYTFTGYRKFLDPDGYPAIAPPWGTLNAIDLKTGKFLWKIPLGEYPALAAKGLKNTGSELYGGPIVTGSGVVFIGATVYDHMFRAFDARNGKLLWETDLGYAGIATPSTYMVDGKQYVVIAASGGRDAKGPVGGQYEAFALQR